MATRSLRAGVVSVTTSTLALSPEAHAGMVMLLDRAAGVTITLPPAIGSGDLYSFVVGTVPTSNQHRINVTGNDSMRGTAVFESDNASDAALAFVTGADTDQLNLNGTTTGGASIGDWVDLLDIKADQWAVRVQASASGTEATPFSTGQIS